MAYYFVIGENNKCLMDDKKFHTQSVDCTKYFISPDSTLVDNKGNCLTMEVGQCITFNNIKSEELIRNKNQLCFRNDTLEPTSCSKLSAENYVRLSMRSKWA